MIDILLALGLWYGLGTTAAMWAATKGHASDLWIIGAAMWGALMVLLLALARLTVLARPAQPQLPVRHKPEAGLHVLLILHVDDSPKEALASLAGMTLPISALDVIVLVSEEASSRLINAPETAAAEQSLHRVLRAIPPVETAAAITSLSGLNHLARQGWHADVVIAAPRMLDRRLNRAAVRAVSRLGHVYHDVLEPTDPPRTRTPRTRTRTLPSTGQGIPESLDAA